VVLIIQHAGLYASINTLRGVAMDAACLSFYMIGLLSQREDKDPKESRHSMVAYCEPLLDTFGVPHARLEGPERRAPDSRVLPAASRRVAAPPLVLVEAGDHIIARVNGRQHATDQCDGGGLGEEPTPPPPDQTRWLGSPRSADADRGEQRTAVCIPTMTTAPAWRTIAPDDLSATLRRLHGRASSLGLGIRLRGPIARHRVRRGRLAPHAARIARHRGGRGARNLAHLLFKNGVYITPRSSDHSGASRWTSS